MDITVGSQILLPRELVQSPAGYRLLKDLEYVNPAWHQAYRLGLAVWHIPKTITTYKLGKDGSASVYRGEVAKVKEAFPMADWQKETEVIPCNKVWDVSSSKFQADVYQKRAIEAMKNQLQGIILATTSAGKTFIVSKAAAELGQKTLILVHRKILLDQFKAALKEWCPDLKIGIIGGGKCEVGDEVTIAIDKSFAKHKELFNEFGAVFTDECFIGPTKVTTMAGEKRIDEVSLGDLVLGASGFNKVLAVSERDATTLLKLKFADGTTLVCTPNHPIFTVEGIHEAKHLVPGMLCFRYALHAPEKDSLRDLSQVVRPLETGVAPLQSDLFLETHVNTSEDEKPHVQPSVQIEDVQNAQKNRSQTEDSGREWANHPCPCQDPSCGSGSGLACRALCSHERCWDFKSAESLQDRPSTARRKTRHRGGWSEPLSSKKETPGCEEGFGFEQTRLESIENYEQRSDGGSREGFEKGRKVYNLQVENHPSYIANGILVHNCHLVPANTFFNIVNNMPARHRYGLTGTLTRKDKKDFLIKATFGDVIAEIKKEELLKMDRISPVELNIIYTGFELPEEFHQTEHANIFQDIEMALAKNEDRIQFIADQAIHILNSDADKRLMVLTRFVEQAEKIREKILEKGLKCGLILGGIKDGKTQCDALDSGELRIAVATVGTVSTGVSINHLTDLILVAPIFNNEGLLHQIRGRLARRADGKEKGVLHMVFDSEVYEGWQLSRFKNLFHK